MNGPITGFYEIYFSNNYPWMSRTGWVRYLVMSVVSLCAIPSCIIATNFTRSIKRNLTLTTCDISCRTLKIKTDSLHILRVVLYERETWYLPPMCRGEMTRNRRVSDEVLGKILSLKRRNFLGGWTELHNVQLRRIRAIKFIRNGIHVAHMGTMNMHIKILRA
jgi:hypothetical protein